MSPPRYRGSDYTLFHMLLTKVLVEGASQLCKCVFTVVMVMWFPQWGITALSVANVSTIYSNNTSEYYNCLIHYCYIFSYHIQSYTFSSIISIFTIIFLTMRVSQ